MSRILICWQGISKTLLHKILQRQCLRSRVVTQNSESSKSKEILHSEKRPLAAELARHLTTWPRFAEHSQDTFFVGGFEHFFVGKPADLVRLVAEDQLLAGGGDQ